MRWWDRLKNMQVLDNHTSYIQTLVNWLLLKVLMIMSLTHECFLYLHNCEKDLKLSSCGVKPNMQNTRRSRRRREWRDVDGQNLAHVTRGERGDEEEYSHHCKKSPITRIKFWFFICSLPNKSLSLSVFLP